LDLVVSLLPDEESPAEESFTLTTTIAGRPNVGKSSLLNKLCGYDRALVSPVAGTTRDPVDTTITYNGDAIRIIDTAGLRRRAKFDSALEYYSYVRTLSALDRSDTAIMMMDANDPCTTQDKRIISQIVEKGKGLVLVLNKWDMMKGEGKAAELMKKVREEMPFVSYAPILLTSALTGRGVQKVLDALLAVNVNRGKRIPTSGLNRLMRDVLAFDRLPSDRKGKTLKVYYCSQAEVNPPTFIFFVNNPELVSSSFDNHVVNKLRTLEDFSGTPIRTHWKGRSENDA
ncbi:MAG: ribosome biogenesis GTPase Der, partial [Synergistaceae bacterium]|nr:ribosome biogenesis GTPase Der [Synergistaceae bacterium]